MKLESVFTDGIVLQRDMPIRIFGTGKGRASVTLLGETSEAEMDGAHWTATLSPRPAGGPYDMTVELNGETVVLHDVMIGDVYIAAGQSNMEMPLFRTYNAFREAENCADEGIRFFNIPRRLENGREMVSRHFEYQVTHDAPWKHCDEQTALHFSAIGYYFAKLVREKHHIPVGIIDCSWGATPIEPFIPFDEFEINPALENKLRSYMEAVENADDGEHRRLYEKYLIELKEYSEERKQSFEICRKYGHRFTYAVDTATKALPEIPYGKYSKFAPGKLWETMTSHVCPMAVRGVLWYQGETNRMDKDYFEKYGALLSSWRRKFMLPDLPFFACELAPFRMDPLPGPQNDNTGFAFLREQQHRAAREYPFSYLAPTGDLGDETDIHPPEKYGLSRRLFRLADSFIYGSGENVLSPEYDRHTVNPDGSVLVFVRNVKKLCAYGRIKDFRVAGEDGIFHYCTKASLVGDCVIRIQAPDVPEPKYIRYGFQSYNRAGNVYGDNGLPLLTFRTDRLEHAETVV